MALNEENLKKVRNRKIWIDLKEPSEREIELVKKKFRLHPTTVEDIKSHNSRSKVEEFPSYLSVVVYDIIKKRKELESSEIDLIIGKNFIITASEGEIKELEELKKNRKRLSRLLLEGSDAMLYFIVDRVMGNYIPILEKIDDKIDDLEDDVTKDTSKDVLNRIMEVRSRVILIKRLIHPQRERIGMLAKGEFKYIREQKLPYFRDLYDDTYRITETVDSAREGLNSVYDVYMSAISYNTNEVMKILSIAATIVMPLTFITGIYGMNFRHMPGLDNVWGFWITMLSMGFLVLLMLVFFKRRQWI